MTIAIVPIIEGQGEEMAIGIILRRIVADLNPPSRVRIVRAFRKRKDKLLKAGELERAVEEAAITGLTHAAD